MKDCLQKKNLDVRKARSMVHNGRSEWRSFVMGSLPGSKYVLMLRCSLCGCSIFPFQCFLRLYIYACSFVARMKCMCGCVDTLGNFSEGEVAKV